jgi:hypothetical protein
MRALVVVAVLAACGGGAGEPDAIVLLPADAPPPPPDAEPCTRAECTSCGQLLPCPFASTNRVTVCGHLRDVETDDILPAAAPMGQACGDGATDGPCAMAITFYDALDYAGDPAGATPLAFEELFRDDCGRYIARNITRPVLGGIAIVVDDAASAPDDHRPTIATFASSSGQVRTRQSAYSLRVSTDVAWAATASAGDTVLSDGALLSLYRDDDDEPLAGVQLATDAFYFSDADPRTRSTIAPALDATSVNGAALRLGSPSTSDGTAPPGCTYVAPAPGAIPGVLIVEPIFLTCE